MTPIPSSSKTKKEIEAINEKIKDTKLKFTDLLFPIILIVVLLGIAIFAFMPNINNAIELRGELANVEKKEEQLENLKGNLDKIDEQELGSNLTDVKTVIPKTLRVSSFIYYIDDLANQMNLKSEKISASDVKISTKSEAETVDSYKGVSSPLSYSGSLEEVLSFLDSFYTSSPYIVSPKNINLASREDGKEWELTLNLTGYYIDDGEETKLDIYRPFKAYTDFKSEMEMLSQKAEKLRESN